MGEALLENGFLDILVPAKAVGIRDKKLSERQIEEVVFWCVQFKEHAFFLFLGLQPSPQITQKEESHGQTQTDQKDLRQAEVATLENRALITKLRYRCKQLMGSWLAFEKMVKNGRIDVPILANLINHTRYIKSRIMDLQSKNVWVGSLFPDFVEHLRDELDYFVARFNGQLSADEEKVFWLENNAEHMAFVAHLLNTDYKQSRPLVDQALTLSDEGMEAISAAMPTVPPDLLQMAELSRQFDHLGYARRTDSFANALPTNVSNSIHPVMIKHIIREGARSIERLLALGTSPAKIAGQATLYRQLHSALQTPRLQ